LHINYCDILCVGQRARKSTTEELTGSDSEAIELEKPRTPPPSIPVTPKAATASYII